jgi:hypothetical protein
MFLRASTGARWVSGEIPLATINCTARRPRRRSMMVEYLAKKFAAAGLTPGGSGGPWFQEVPLQVFERLPTVSITLKTRGPAS